MNETDVIRRQLALERAHLREILQVAAGLGPGVEPPAAVSAYMDWAAPRLVRQLAAHGRAPGRVPEAAVAGTAAQLRTLLEGWSAELEALAGGSFPVAHWRQAAGLSADTILEERRRYAAARLAAGLP